MGERLRIAPAAPGDARIVPHLRRADVDEIRAATGLTPAVAVAFSIAASRAWSVLMNDKPTALFGVSPTERPGVGVVWLVATDEIDRYPLRFYRVSRRLFPSLCGGYSELFNWVDARNVRSLRWLGWLGFEVEAAAAWGAEGRLFHRVSWRREEKEDVYGGGRPGGVGGGGKSVSGCGGQERGESPGGG
jgi:uncharacterized membrane protein YgcG